MPSVIELRPSSLAAFVGQQEVADNLAIALNGARHRKEPLGHTVFIGPPGLGKTTLSNIIASEQNSKLVSANGPALTKLSALRFLLEQVKAGGITLFIDEIHRLPRAIEESLYSVMEDFKFSMTTKDEHLELDLPRFTLVGATTRFGLLTKPLRDRFTNTFHLGFYGQEELEEVIRRSAQRSQIIIEDSAISELAKRSRGTPRIANNLLIKSRDFAISFNIEQVSYPVALGMFEKINIDSLGLERFDRSILEVIIDKFQGGPVGLDAIANILVEEPDVIESVYEPFLLKLGLIVRTSKGREATQLAFDYLGRTRGTNGNGPALRGPKPFDEA